MLKTAQQVQIKVKAEGKEYGKEGNPVELITNHYPVQIKAVPCFQYDIDIKVRKRKDNETVPFRGPFNEKVEIINKMVNDWGNIFRPNNRLICFTTDGAKYIFTKTKLNFEDEETRQVTLTLDGYQEQTFEVKIALVDEVDMNTINSFYGGQDVEFSMEQVRDIQLQVYDIASSERQKLSHVSVGRSLFPTKRAPNDEIRSPNENTIIAFGHFQSLVMTESGVTANFDRATTAFRTGPVEEPLVNFIAKELKTTNIGNYAFNARTIHDMSKRLNGLKVYSNHIKINGIPQKRKKAIDCMADTTPGIEKMEKDGKVMTIEQYFRDTYQVNIQYKNVPLIKVKGGSKEKPIYWPVDVCHVYPNQAMPRNLIDPDIQSRLTEASNTMSPLKRFDKIQQARDSVVAEDQANGNLMNGFGLSIAHDPIKLTGRQLNPPNVKGDMKNLANPFPGGLKNYIVFNLSRKVQEKGFFDSFEFFFKHQGFGLIVTAGRMGLQIANKPMNSGNEINENELIPYNKAMIAFERYYKVYTS